MCFHIHNPHSWSHRKNPKQNKERSEIMDSTYSQIIPEYDINKEPEGSNGQEMIPIRNDFEADVLLIQIHDHKMEKDL